MDRGLSRAIPARAQGDTCQVWGLLPKANSHGLRPALHRTHAAARHTCGPDPRQVGRSDRGAGAT
eukprot:3499192-Alexandrium_andersonii.AAC.1